MSANDDPFYGCCDWIGNGRCHYPGVFQHGNGRWYCRAHDQCADPVLGAQIVELGVQRGAPLHGAASAGTQGSASPSCED